MSPTIAARLRQNLAVSRRRPPCGAARSRTVRAHGGRRQRGEQVGRVRLITAEAVNEERPKIPSRRSASHGSIASRSNAAFMSLCGNSAIQLQLGAGHDTAFVRREVNDPIGYVVRFAKPSERHLARQLCKHSRLVTLPEQRIENRGPDKGRVNGLQRMSQPL